MTWRLKRINDVYFNLHIWLAAAGGGGAGVRAAQLPRHHPRGCPAGHVRFDAAGGENVLPVRPGMRATSSSSRFRGSNPSASAITSVWTA